MFKTMSYKTEKEWEIEEAGEDQEQMVYILNNGILVTSQQSAQLCCNRDDPHCDI